MSELVHKMATPTEKDTGMETREQKNISIKWELYSPQQQDVILAEFRQKQPDNYYCKTALFEFLSKKLSMEYRNKG